MLRGIFGLASLVAFIASSSCFIVYRDLGRVGAWVGLALVPLFAWLARWRPALDLEAVVEGQGGGQHALTPELRAWLGGKAGQIEPLYRDGSLRFAVVTFLVGLAGAGWFSLVVAPKAARAPIPFLLAAFVLSGVLWPSGRQLYRWWRAPLRPGVWLRDGHILVVASTEQFVCRDLAADLVTYSRAETRRDDRPVTNLHLLFDENGPHPPILLFSVADGAVAGRLAQAIEQAQVRGAEAELAAEQAATREVRGAAPYREAKRPAQVVTRDLLLRLWGAGPPRARLPLSAGVVGLGLVLGAGTWLGGVAISQQRALDRCETIACHEKVLADALFVLWRARAERGIQRLYRQAFAAAQHDPPKLRQLASASLSSALRGDRRQAVAQEIQHGSRQRLRTLYGAALARVGLAKAAGPAALRALLEAAAASDAHRLLLVVDSRLEAPHDPRQLGAVFGHQKTIPLASSFGPSQRRQREYRLAASLQKTLDDLVGPGLLEVVRATGRRARGDGHLARLLVDYRVQPTQAVYFAKKRPWAAIGKPADQVARYRSYYSGVRVVWRLSLRRADQTLLALQGAATPAPRFTVRSPRMFGFGASAKTVYAGMLQSALSDLTRVLRGAFLPGR